MKQSLDQRDKYQPLLSDYAQTNAKGQGIFTIKLSSSRPDSGNANSVHFVAESDSHGLFEVRFHRLANVDHKHNFEDDHSKQDCRVSAYKEALKKFEQFASISMYYS